MEKSLKRKNIPYRLYQYRRKFNEKTNDLILDWKEEIAIYKMHGSINWFDKTDYEKEEAEWQRLGYPNRPPHAFFDGRMDNEIYRLLDEPFDSKDLFRNMYIISNLGKYFDTYFNEHRYKLSDSPFIIPPSHYKLMNLQYLSDYWYRFSTRGSGVNKIVIIGFSLPAHDEYIRQPLYWFIRNFQYPDDSNIGKKPKLKIVDFQTTQKLMNDFKLNYRFVDPSQTVFYFDGFSEEVLDKIFSEE